MPDIPLLRIIDEITMTTVGYCCFYGAMCQ